MAHMALHRLAPSQKGIVQSVFSAKPLLNNRLLEMGITRGTGVEFVKTAPLGDPIEILVRGYRLSLRKEEAEAILVERVAS
jgi:ferrous iron transport protein A